MSQTPEVSFVVPLYNEGARLEKFHQTLQYTANKVTSGAYEVIYVDDGSDDATSDMVAGFHAQDSRVKLARLSRNFGKESALSAGIQLAVGNAIIMLDGDGQHPVDQIPQFISRWRQGAQVVVGMRRNKQSTSLIKNASSGVFYAIFNRLANQSLLEGATDYRLIDRAVQRAFLLLPENDRVTRGLIDWLGFKRDYVYFDVKMRIGVSGYTYKKLLRLAVNSIVSLTPTPLYAIGYVGMSVTFLSGLLGAAVLLEQLVVRDPLRWHFTGTAMLAILIIFLVGILLTSQAILALYVASIQTQVRRRPLYVLDYHRSVGLIDAIHED